MNTAYTYEIEFDVMGACRARYKKWLSDDSIGWVSHPAVDAFEVQYNTDGLSPEVKFLFGFSSIEQWTAFVTSDRHDAAKETLRGVTTQLDGTLWKQGGIRLDETNSTDSDTPTSSAASLSEEPS